MNNSKIVLMLGEVSARLRTSTHQKELGNSWKKGVGGVFLKIFASHSLRITSIFTERNILPKLSQALVKPWKKDFSLHLHPRTNVSTLSIRWRDCEEIYWSLESRYIISDSFMIARKLKDVTVPSDHIFTSCCRSTLLALCEADRMWKWSEPQNQVSFRLGIKYWN